MSKKYNVVKGKAGENIAVKYLESRKYKVLDTNFRCKIGEIDIVCLDGKDIVFAEVKLRQSRDYGYPSQAVNYHKQRKISKTALYYLQTHDLFHLNVRFDVIEIIKNSMGTRINHIENAFEIIM